MMKQLGTTKGLLLGLCLTTLVACGSPGAETGAETEASRSSPPDMTATGEPTTGDTELTTAQTTTQTPNLTNACQVIEQGSGPQGEANIRVEEVVTGLDSPWGLLFLSDTDMLVTERAGRIRLVRNGTLQPEPVVTIPATEQGEGGLLGITPHPDFASNRLFYVYYTASSNGRLVNRVERWQLAETASSASRDRLIIDNIPAASVHNGGRLRFGPDGMLYIGTGDARDADSSQDENSLAGKILRLTADGEVPDDNPFNNPVYVTGIRNTQGFDWLDDTIMIVTDHGPSGEFGWRGHDEVHVATAGDNLGWPNIYGCQTAEGELRPVLTWREAVPPGGAAIYTGTAIPEWQGNLMMGTLRSRHLHRVALAADGSLQSHAVYLQGEYGRLRETIMGPDGNLYVTTSNCDGRGDCPPERDKVLRITR